jgi:hypothetical protein
MVFQTSANGVQQVWIAELNPLTGLLVSATGKDLLVDTDVAAIGPQGDTTNGPEWGLDSEGAAVFYSKRDANGVVQCWRASNLVPGGVKAEPLTDLEGPDGEGAIMVIARKDASRPTTQVIYRYIPAPRFREGGAARWADETAPDAVHDVPQFNGAAAAPSWIEGTEDFVYAMLVAPRSSEIARFNTAIGCDNIGNAMGGVPWSRLFVLRRRADRFEAGRFEDIGGTDLVSDFGGVHHDSSEDRAGPDLNLCDLDNDGDLGLLQSCHVNIRDAELIEVRVEAREPGTDRLTGARWVHANHSYKSGGALEANLGLGKRGVVDLVVALPGGRQVRFDAVRGDRLLDIDLVERKALDVKAGG